MSEAPRGRLLVVTGPTGSGKTDLAVALASRFGGELVGADSVQVYRGFDIGSAKPTAATLRGVPHHLLDVAEPDETLDAKAFASLADAAIESIRARGKVAIVVGGSGLWLRALLRGLVQLPPVDVSLRSELQARAGREGSAALHVELAQIDPEAAQSIHPNDAVRVVRALEVFHQTGHPLGALRRRHALGSPRYDALRVVLDPDPEALHHRVVARVDAMLKAGFVEEVTRLVERHGRGARALGSVGYAQLLAHVCDGAQLADAREQIIRATRIYARRQRTWLRSEPGDAWWVAEAQDVLSEPGLVRLSPWLDPEAGCAKVWK